MATLAADKVRKFRNILSGTNIELPAVASDIVYRGAAVGSSSGNARPLVAGDVFMGFAAANADNSAGSAGDVGVDVITEGEVYLSITGISAVSNYAAAVYASDDDTFTTASTSNTQIGKVTQWDTGTNAWVKFQGSAQRSI